MDIDQLVLHRIRSGLRSGHSEVWVCIFNYWGNEFVTIAFVITSALGAALCLSRRGHIAITFFIDALPLQIKKIVYLVGLVLIAVINIVMIDFAIDWISMAGHSPWQPFRWPQGIVHAAIPVGCELFVFSCGLKFILTIGGRESVEVLWVPED